MGLRTTRSGASHATTLAGPTIDRRRDHDGSRHDEGENEGIREHVGEMLAPGRGVQIGWFVLSASGRRQAPRLGANRTRPETMNTPRNAYSWFTSETTIERTASAPHIP